MNEDRLLICPISGDCSLYILADGMGGYTYGDFAAQLIIDTIREYVIKDLETASPKKVLRMAIEQANEKIYNESVRLKSKMGAAVTILLSINKQVYIAWLGDVRAYLISNNQIELLTTDHRLVKSQDVPFDYASILTRCIKGKKFENTIPVNELSIEKGDKLIVCSDGFYRSIQEECLLYFSLKELIQKIYDPKDDYSAIEISFQ